MLFIHNDVVAKLPQPPVPFGLSLAFGVEFTPKTAKVLASFDNLQMLTLSGSTISGGTVNDSGSIDVTGNSTLSGTILNNGSVNSAVKIVCDSMNRNILTPAAAPHCLRKRA